MSQSKLFDYNSSFSVIRTNPKLSGNFRITVDSSAGVWFNSMDVNPTLSDSRFKKFNITGNNSFSVDLFNFFDQGKTSSDLVFQVGNFTNGNKQAAQDFSGQYDFFYGSGASVLADKNYTESFKYFAPLWLKNEIPDYFVIFKVPNPLDYPYSKNVTTINASVLYKVIQDYDSTEDFSISYGKDSSGREIVYKSGSLFTGNSNFSTYTIASGKGKVVIFNELENLSLVDDIDSTFSNKILPNAAVVKTFDLRANTKIGKYIRSIFNNPLFNKSPLNISWGSDSYSYFNGVSYSDGIFTRKGELLNPFLTSSKSDPMIDFEDYVTSGFSRNGVICPNILNIEFLFDDSDSDLYTINRYIGLYVSRNDIAEFKMNGDFFYKYKNLEGNSNYPKPVKNNIGYYYNNYSTVLSATSGIRLFYEGASGFLPGSDNTNLYDPNKLFYITDKNDNFYSLKRSEDYKSPGGDSPYGSYGYFDYTTGTFSATGSTGATCGTFVIGNKSVDLLNFTGTDDKIASIKALTPSDAGRAYSDIEFLKIYDLDKPLTFKIFWPNGSQKDGNRKFDIVKSGDFSSILAWVAGSYYSTGNSYYFNASTGDVSDIASSFSWVLKDVSETVWDTGSDLGSSIIRVRNTGDYGNVSYSVSVFDDYDSFVTVYKGNWSNDSSYSTGDVVIYNDEYFCANFDIPATPLTYNDTPGGTAWNSYSTFSSPEYLKINGTDASYLTSNISFIGGTKTKNSRIIFESKNSTLVQPGYYVNTSTGRSKILDVTRYVDSPIRQINTEKVIGFNNFETYLVVNLEDENAVVLLGSDQSFNVYSSATCYVGAFTIFDVKEFDFDFWSSDYKYTPTPETYKYYQLQIDEPGVIKENIPYIVKSGQIFYAGSNVYNQGDIFYGVTGYTSFSNSNSSNTTPVVFPLQYSNVVYNGTDKGYNDVKYYKDLESFNGFLGIQSLSPDSLPSSSSKEQIFSHGKLNSEYEYLEENYTIERANRSRIVPYINKWGYTSGIDARGNQYRLNSSPAFSPLNFSPSLDRIGSDPKYLTHEWFLLEQPPSEFPKEFMNLQNSYLPYKIDLNKARSCDPTDSLYIASYLTVEPEDYSPDYSEPKFYTKELFTPFYYNPASKYYETVFRGVKIVLKKRSSLTTKESDSPDKYVPDYRGYEDYKFSAILRAIPENTDSIQSPVSYEIIENSQQKFILFICDVVIKDQRVFELGYTGGTGSNPTIDYTTLYSISSKNSLNSSIVTGSSLFSLDDIKLSAALDLSLPSGSYVNTNKSTGIINILKNPNYDSDLREEIHVYYSPNADGATGGLSPIGSGSFYVHNSGTLADSTYPWPTGVGPSYVEFGRVSVASNYLFTIPFSSSSPATVPIGPSSVYKDRPVFQKSGGDKYYDSILVRCTVPYIAKKINESSPYINYNSYSWDSNNSLTEVASDSFQFYFEKPTKIVKTKGTSFSENYAGPQELKGSSVANSYILTQGNPKLPSIIARYSGGYEPLFRKIIFFNRHKGDSISGNNVDLSFRNCNLAPNKEYFGVSRNISYTKVSLGSPILSLSSSYPEGAVYPLIGQSPIDTRNMNLFSSTWDPGYYYRYTNSKDFVKVAGTRSMKEYSTFFGSKIMQTPMNVTVPNYITLQISRTSGDGNVAAVNTKINDYLKSIQTITTSNSGTGIGSVGPYLSATDYDKLDLNIFPNAELIWQYFSETNKISGIIRLDRMLRRYLLNSGIKQVFLDNIISDFGVGDPNSIDDDVNSYIDQNVSPIYSGNVFDLYVKKVANKDIPVAESLRGDIAAVNRYKLGYYIDANYKIAKVGDLIYNFEFQLEANYNYSLLFNFLISKI